MTSTPSPPPDPPEGRPTGVPQSGYLTPPPGFRPYSYAPVRPTNNLAIVSLVVSMAMFSIVPPLAIIGAIIGHRARRQIRERGEDGDGLALAGVIVGWVGFALGVVGVAVVLAIGFPELFPDPAG